jgi:hypothetical protein
MRERRENAKHTIYAKCEMRDVCEMLENAKIAALQQVQYKLLLYGLYVSIET